MRNCGKIWLDKSDYQIVHRMEDHFEHLCSTSYTSTIHNIEYTYTFSIDLEFKLSLFSVSRSHKYITIPLNTNYLFDQKLPTAVIKCI